MGIRETPTVLGNSKDEGHERVALSCKDCRWQGVDGRVGTGTEMCSWAAGEPGSRQEVQMNMKVPGNSGQTLDPGCRQGVGAAGITAFTQDGHRTACGCWQQKRYPQSHRCHNFFLLVIEG